MKIRRKIAQTGNKTWGKTFVFISKFCSVTYLDFLHARIIHDCTSIKSFGESYLVQFSVNYKTPFFDVSATLDNFVMHVTKLKHLGRFKRWSAPNKEEHELFKSLNLFFLQDPFVSYWLLRGQNRNSAYKPIWKFLPSSQSCHERVFCNKRRSKYFFTSASSAYYKFKS